MFMYHRFSAPALLLTASLAVPAAAFAQTWDTCVYDPEYVTDYEFSIEQVRVIRGLAYYDGDPNNFPAPLTGTYLPGFNSYSFTIGYRQSNASRYYWVDGNTGQGYSWAVVGESSEYYDSPRPAELRLCSTRTDQNDTAPAPAGPTGTP